MRKSSLLPDAFYDEQAKRLSGLPKYPAAPAAQQELRRALRQISESDAAFIQRLINEVVDTNTVCPTPADLTNRAGAIRHQAQKSLGNPACKLCEGTGWVHTTKPVKIGGLAPYDAEFSRPCSCREEPVQMTTGQIAS